MRIRTKPVACNVSLGCTDLIRLLLVVRKFQDQSANQRGVGQSCCPNCQQLGITGMGLRFDECAFRRLHCAIRVRSATKFGSQVLPPSSENACSTWYEFGVMPDQTNRTRMVRPLSVC